MGLGCGKLVQRVLSRTKAILEVPDPLDKDAPESAVSFTGWVSRRQSLLLFANHRRRGLYLVRRDLIGDHPLRCQDQASGFSLYRIMSAVGTPKGKAILLAQYSVPGRCLLFDNQFPPQKKRKSEKRKSPVIATLPFPVSTTTCPKTTTTTATTTLTEKRISIALSIFFSGLDSKALLKMSCTPLNGVGNGPPVWLTAIVSEHLLAKPSDIFFWCFLGGRRCEKCV